MPDLSLFIPPLNSSDWFRTGLVYLHLLSCAFALALVLSADWRIIKGDFTLDGLRRTAQGTSVVLVFLWVTGGLLVHHDTGLDLAVIARLSKLQLKLLVVAALTINGVLLHFVSFPLITANRKLTLLESVVLAVTGTISTSHWLLAAFIGIARPLGQWPLETLLAAYVTGLCAMIVLGTFCAPFLRIHLARRLSTARFLPDRRRWNNTGMSLQAHESRQPLLEDSRRTMPVAASHTSEQLSTVRVSQR